MSVLNIQTVQPGLVGTLPAIAYIQTNDTEATVLTAGYLNQAVQSGLASFSLPCMCCVSTMASASAQPVPGWYALSYSAGNWSLVSPVSPGGITLPTIANHLIVSTDVSGTLANLTGTAINNGSIQAGLSGTAGTLISFPSVASKGSLIVAGVANTGNTNVTVSNAAHGQASVYSIPDSGASTANFIVSKLTGTQHITVGSLEVDAGNISAGISGTAGTLISFPATAANGTLILAAANAGGAFNTTISNGTMGQSTVYSMGDIGAATGGLVVATSAIRMKSVAQAAVAGGAAAQTVTDAFCTSGSMVVCTWNDTTNAVTIQKAVAGNGSFVVTSSGDPGSSHLNYIITK